jgi:ferredoxin
VGDVFGLIGLLGIGMALYRRYVRPPAKLTWDRRQTEDAIIVGLLGFVLFTGFIVEGLRIGGDEIPAGNEDWSYWSPGGWTVATILDGLGVGEQALIDTHRWWWWFHVVAAFTFLTLLAFTKFRHIVFAPMNAFLKRPASGPAYLMPMGDFEKIMEEGGSLGASKLQDFTWKQLFDADTCVRCGRCTQACPAWTAGQPLSPMAIIQDLKLYMNHAGPLVIAGKDPAEQLEQDLVGGYIKTSRCGRAGRAWRVGVPVMIEHVPTIVDMRRYLVMEKASVPPTAQAALQNIEQRGHPWRGTQLTRETWIEQLAANGINVPIFDGTQEYLYCVGCSGALVERNVPITQSVVKLLIEAGVSFGVLGQAETCNGDPARRLGNEFLYATLAETNAQAFNEMEVRRVITACPHCFNTSRTSTRTSAGSTRSRTTRSFCRCCSRAATSKPHRKRRGDERRDHHLPRLLLPGPLQRHLRRPARSAGEHPRGEPGGDAAQPGQGHVLRRGRREHVAGGAGHARQPPAGRRGREHRREHRRHRLPVLHPDVRGRHPGSAARRGEAQHPRLRHRRAAEVSVKPARASSARVRWWCRAWGRSASGAGRRGDFFNSCRGLPPGRSRGAEGTPDPPYSVCHGGFRPPSWPE